MKNKGLIIFLICLLSIVSILLIWFMVMLLNGKTNFMNFSSNYRISKEIIIDENYDTDFNKIFISSKAAEIHISESLDNSIGVNRNK